MRFQPSLTGTLNLGRTNAFFLGGGKALVNAYYLTAAKLGVEILYDTEVLSLNMEDGAVRSIDITYKRLPRDCARPLRGRLLRRLPGQPGLDAPVLGRRGGQLRHPRHALQPRPGPEEPARTRAWRQSAIPTQCHAVALDARAPKFDGGITTRLDSVPYSVVVNRDGDRFYDEGEDVWPKRYAIWGRLIAQQPGQIAYSICDAKAFPLFMPSVFPAIKADTLEELAAKMKLDPTKVRETVDGFNKAVKPGQAFDNLKLDGNATEGLTPNKTNWARPIDKPPFYGYPLRPGITFTYLGVRVNEKAQVLMENGQPAGNLFASGEIMSGNILGKGYLAGFGMTIGTVFGRIAGQEAARRARN